MEGYRNDINDLKSAAAPVFIVHAWEQAQEVREAGGSPFNIGEQTIPQFVESIKAADIIPQRILILTLGENDTGEDLLKAADLYKYGIMIHISGANLFRETAAPDQRQQRIKEIIAAAEKQEKEEQEAGLETIKNESAAAYLQEFVDGIKAGADTPAQPTGFNNLDGALGGGLYEGLYVIGGLTSLGKTTLVLQIADQIAAAGKDVLIFSLEMARTELMSKSISRHTIKEVLSNRGNIRLAKTARGITDGSRYKHYDIEEKKLIQAAIKSYDEYADHVYITEGLGDIGVNEVRGKVARFVTLTGRTPVIIVDYLQILSPVNPRATDKQSADKNVIELKRISRDYKTPVIAISSFNRQTYKKEVDYESFKESGGIEYGTDVLIGLQFSGAGQADFNEKEEKQKDPREIELHILKNRNGKIGDVIEFRYYPLFNYFKEV